MQENEDGILVATECECRKKSIAKRRLKFAEIPEAYKDMDLKTFRTDVYRKPESKAAIKIACEIIKEYLSRFEEFHESGKGLYIYSSTKGSGKTRMAASIANELMNNRDKQVKFSKSTTILSEIGRCIDGEGEYTMSRLLDHLEMTDILVIDDFGTETASNWVKEKFYHIINERYVNKKVTIFTSNDSLQNLRYGDRIVSRVGQMTYQITFPEESVREHIADADNKEMINRIADNSIKDRFVEVNNTM